MYSFGVAGVHDIFCFDVCKYEIKRYFPAASRTTKKAHLTTYFVAFLYHPAHGIHIISHPVSIVQQVAYLSVTA